MSLSKATIGSIACLCLFGFLAAGSGSSSTSSSSSSSDAADSSFDQAPVIDPIYNSRNPRTCPALNSPPNGAEAAALLQCTMEYKSADLEMLLENVSVQITASPSTGPESVFNDLDSTTPEIDIVGNATEYLCGPVAGTTPGQSCNTRSYTNSVGKCYKTLNAGYKCQLQTVPVFKENSVAPPTTF